jgi:hypothetical protein
MSFMPPGVKEAYISKSMVFARCLAGSNPSGVMDAKESGSATSSLTALGFSRCLWIFAC